MAAFLFSRTYTLLSKCIAISLWLSSLFTNCIGFNLYKDHLKKQKTITCSLNSKENIVNFAHLNMSLFCCPQI